MGDKQIRLGQLIAPFGPGSLYTDKRGIPHVMCGLDHWFKRSDPVRGLVPCDDPLEFELFEPRLAELLRVERFRSPPDFRDVRRGEPPPPNAQLRIPAQRFPRWYRHTKTGKLRRFNLHTARIDAPRDGGRYQPVRFISVCDAGHLGEFPWKEWIGCACPGDGEMVLTDRGGSELTSITVKCLACPPGSTGHTGKHLGGTTIKPDPGDQSAFERAGITCSGDRPWLGEGAHQQGCQAPLIGALINQTNLYFGRTISAILLPDFRQENDEVIHLRNLVEQDHGNLGIARMLWNMNNKAGSVALIQAGLAGRGIQCTPAQIEQALEALFSAAGNADHADVAAPAAGESEWLAFRRAEFNIIRREVNDPERFPHLRVIPTTVPLGLSQWFAKVNLVERLRETRAFYGFDRLKQDGNTLEGMPETAMLQLFRHPLDQPHERWLPAIKVFGEGIYIELNESQVTQWQSDQRDWLAERLDDGFVTRVAGVYQTLPPGPATREWASRYLLVHTLAHILINQLVFECGYSTASLRERLYVSADAAAPMAGILIYTAAGDSEGTLGGLVRLGRPERLGPVVQRALSRAAWCSADPVCSENLGGQGSKRANLAACHACVLLPETSCETINQGLDRSMVIGVPENRAPGFMSAIIEEPVGFE